MPASILARRAALLGTMAAALAIPATGAHAGESTCLPPTLPGVPDLCAPAATPPAAPAPAPSPAHPHPASCRDANLMPNGSDVSRLRHATLCLLNQERRRHGLRPLRSNPKLGAVAQSYSHQMVTRSFFDHTSPTGATFVQRIARTGYLARTASYALGENLAWAGGSLSTPRKVMNMWMHSPGHRRNILDRRFREVGIGVALGTPDHDGGGATYTTEFGERSR